MRNQIIRWVAIGFVVFLAITIILTDYRHLPSLITKLYSFPYGDLISHFVLFGMQSFLICMAFPDPRTHLIKTDVPILTLILVVFIIVEAASQYFISLRIFSWLDLAASLAGWGLGWGICGWIRRNHS